MQKKSKNAAYAAKSLQKANNYQTSLKGHAT